ncbi:MAG: acyl-CoA dehydrogenase family protein [candidate division KSB1 bacterium]|nr:acyl-CoA dehydrogenase family protein [candidate division KSB1 bacterium]
MPASEIATKVAHQAIQIVGEQSPTQDTPMERIYRDVRLCEIGEETSEIQRLVVAREFLKDELDVVHFKSGLHLKRTLSYTRFSS